MLKKNLPFHAIVENEVKETPYGEITVTVEVLNGRAKIETVNIVKRKRLRY